MELSVLARAVLPERYPGAWPPRILRTALPDHRTQRCVLSDADRGGGSRLGRAHARRLRVRLEGIEVHHPLEAAERHVAKQPGVAGGPPAAAWQQGRTGAVPVTSAVREEPRAPGCIPQVAPSPQTLRVRVSTSELVRGRRARPVAGQRHRSVHFGPSRCAVALDRDGGPRLRSRPWSPGALSRSLFTQHAGFVGSETRKAAQGRTPRLRLFRQRPEERRAERRLAPDADVRRPRWA